VRNIGLLQYGYLDRGEKAVKAQQLQQTGGRAHLGMFVQMGKYPGHVSLLGQ
jgi:hypothetical protein